MLNIAFWWGILMTIGKLTNIVQCSWWLVWLPFPITILVGVVMLMYVNMMFSGSIKFWK